MNSDILARRVNAFGSISAELALEISANDDRRPEVSPPARQGARTGLPFFHSKRTTEKWRASLDLQDVLARLRTTVQPMPEAAARTLRELETTLAAAVTASHHGEQRTQSHGLSVFAPYRMNKRLEAYGQTSLGAGNHWTHLRCGARRAG